MTLKAVKSTCLQNINKTWLYSSLLNCYIYLYVEIPTKVANHLSIQHVCIEHLL